MSLCRQAGTIRERCGGEDPGDPRRPSCQSFSALSATDNRNFPNNDGKGETQLHRCEESERRIGKSSLRTLPLPGLRTNYRFDLKPCVRVGCVIRLRGLRRFYSLSLDNYSYITLQYSTAYHASTTNQAAKKHRFALHLITPPGVILQSPDLLRARQTLRSAIMSAITAMHGK